MHWEWVIGVGIILFWIINSLFQGAERERARGNRPRPLPGGERPPGERVSRRPPTDIDRFLEEVNRRRRQAAERRPGSVGKEKSPLSSAGPAVSGARPRVAPRPAGRQPPVPVQPARPSLGRIPEALPVLETAAAVEVLAVASALHAAPAQNLPPRMAPPPPSAGSAAPENTSSELPPLAELLRAPDNLRTAVILHEIFSPPRCYRPGIR
jgi:hypothetical protein